uniref:Signal peptidase complex subunit 2 n=1 Tax=Cannabis sativa TaxID=3483 RepID=A0A803P152_CANSA
MRSSPGIAKPPYKFVRINLFENPMKMTLLRPEIAHVPIGRVTNTHQYYVDTWDAPIEYQRSRCFRIIPWKNIKRLSHFMAPGTILNSNGEQQASASLEPRRLGANRDCGLALKWLDQDFEVSDFNLFVDAGINEDNSCMGLRAVVIDRDGVILCSDKKPETAPTPPKTPKKTNLLDHHSIKHMLDESVSELIIYTKEKNAILFTYPPVGSFTSTGLEISSKLPRFSDMYTLTIASADPKSISANEPVELTKSVTKWFTKDGVLVEGLFWKDVEALIDQYAKEPKKNK